MITTTALEASNRARADRPLVLVVTRRRAPASDAAVRAVTTAAQALEIEAMALDVDDAENAAFLDELRVEHVPEMLVFSRGVVLERAGASSSADAEELLAAALRHSRLLQAVR
jgi:hypothetical protein